MVITGERDYVDTDHDGLSDLIVGADGADGAEDGAGKVYLLPATAL